MSSRSPRSPTVPPPFTSVGERIIAGRHSGNATCSPRSPDIGGPCLHTYGPVMLCSLYSHREGNEVNKAGHPRAALDFDCSPHPPNSGEHGGVVPI